jgi:hypothetical protein
MVVGEREAVDRGRDRVGDVDRAVVVRITILEIKAARVSDPDKLRNVRAELETLRTARDRTVLPTDALASLTAKLRDVNVALWDIEDGIRECERAGDFGPQFVELARSVYRNNDERAAIKRKINVLLGSQIIEEKSYSAWDQSVVERSGGAHNLAE